MSGSEMKGAKRIREVVGGPQAVTPPVTSPTEGAARHRSDGAVQILNMF